MVFVLTVICVGSGLALSGVYQITKEPIAMTKLQKVMAPAVKAVLKGYDNNPLKDIKKITIGEDDKGRPVKLVIFPAKKKGKTFAVAFQSEGKGFGGDIKIMVGINAKKKDLTGIAIVEHHETPGLGARITEKSFTSSFKGKPIDKVLTPKDINALSGATFSTKGVVAAVNHARELYEQYKDQMLN